MKAGKYFEMAYAVHYDRTQLLHTNFVHFIMLLHTHLLLALCVTHHYDTLNKLLRKTKYDEPFVRVR